MSKDTPFFKFDSASWLGGTIQFTPLECKGLFIDICALYWESQKPVKTDTKFKVRVRCDQGTLTDLLGTLEGLEIIQQSEAGITVPFLDDLMNDREKFLDKCSKAGKKSALIKGTSTNKKEERRKKKEDSREKIEDNTPSNPPAGEVGGVTPKSPKRMTETKKKRTKVKENSPLMIQIGRWFRRQEKTLWTIYESQALSQVDPSDDDVIVMEAFYTAEINEGEGFYRRQSIDTLLNNWSGELDKAQRFIALRHNEGATKETDLYG